MKKLLLLTIILLLVFSLCACEKAPQAAQSECDHAAYSDLIARLEAGDYDGARSLIDQMDSAPDPEAAVSPQQEATAAPEAALPVPPETEPAALHDGLVVELTKYNVKDYFELSAAYFLGDDSGCIQSVTLKKEYKDRLLRVEDVTVDVSYLLSDAYGKIDKAAEEFKLEYYDILSQERENSEIPVDASGNGRITRLNYSARKGCFPGFAADTDIESGSGKLVLSED